MGRNALTSQEWWDKGYRIIKGEKHRERNKQGVCIFYPDQVRQRGYWVEEPDAFDEDYDDAFAGEWGS